MTYIVKDECIKCKLTDCVDVCPVDCFYEGENFLAINPEECIDCGVCEPECPLDAIKADTEDNDANIIIDRNDLIKLDLSPIKKETNKAPKIMNINILFLGLSSKA